MKYYNIKSAILGTFYQNIANFYCNFSGCQADVPGWSGGGRDTLPIFGKVAHTESHTLNPERLDSQDFKDNSEQGGGNADLRCY